jgi:hypothetical protein
MVFFLFWSPFDVLWFPGYRAALGSSSLYNHPGVAFFHSCCSVAYTLFYLGILCRVSQLRNSGTESSYVWDNILGKISFFAIPPDQYLLFVQR